MPPIIGPSIMLQRAVGRNPKPILKSGVLIDKNLEKIIFNDIKREARIRVFTSNLRADFKNITSQRFQNMVDNGSN